MGKPSPSMEMDTSTEQLLALKKHLLPRYKVILHNDDHNEAMYVIFALLHSVNQLTIQEAEQIMMTAHVHGSAIVIVCPRETAEYYQQRILGYHLNATIEPD